MIEKNIKKILKELEETSCQLICVSKNRSEEEIMEAYHAGVRDFGENLVQELVRKREKLPKDIRWHMIGHLQTNKVKELLSGPVSIIHSVDKVKLAEEINRRSEEVQDILLEINIALEDSKYGFPPNVDFLKVVLKQIEKLPKIHCIGLMCVAPNTEHPEDNLVYFKKMVEIKNQLNLSILSMGMTNDYLAACKAGSSYIRIGTGIFGKRNSIKQKDK